MFLLFLFGTQSLKGEWQTSLRRSLPIEAESTSQKGAVILVTLYLSRMRFEVPPFILNFGQCTKRLWYYVFTVFFLAHPARNHSWWPVWRMWLANNARNGSFYCAKQSMFIINFPRRFLQSVKHSCLVHWKAISWEHSEWVKEVKVTFLM